MAAALERFGRVDLYHLNAGIAGELAPFPEVKADDFDRVLARQRPWRLPRAAGRVPAVRSAGWRRGDRHDRVDLPRSAAARTSCPTTCASTPSSASTRSAPPSTAARSGSASTRSRPGSSPRTCSAPAGADDQGASGTSARALLAPMRSPRARPTRSPALVAFLLSDDAAFVTAVACTRRRRRRRREPRSPVHRRAGVQSAP